MKFKILVFSALVFASCSSDRLDIEVDASKIQIDTFRLDLALGKAKNDSEIKKVHDFYAKTHAEFYDFYLGACLRIGLAQDSTALDALKDFTSDQFMVKLHGEMANAFPSIQKEHHEIEQAFAYLKHHLPDAKLPKNLLFYNSVFSNSVVSSDESIGIGLERYLGEESASIKELPQNPFYPYIKKRMDRQFLSRDVLFSWINSQVFPELNDEQELAEVMIEWGKRFYILEACFPYEEKALILRYFPEEMEWAMENEKEFWNYLVAQNALFKRDFKMVTNLFSDGPFTSGLPIGDEAPPRLGMFLGWRIVQNFMNNNEAIALNQLKSIDFKTIIKSYDL